jgi:hypothetical protein
VAVIVVFTPGLDIVVDTATRDVVAAVFATATLSASADAWRVPQPATSTAEAAKITKLNRPRIALVSVPNALHQGSSGIAVTYSDATSAPK